MRVPAFHGSDAPISDAQVATVARNQFVVEAPRTSAQDGRALNRRRLIAAAAELFLRQGYRHTSLRQIAVAAGCAESAIRPEFGGKLVLLEEVIRACAICDGIQAPRELRSLGLQEDIYRLTAWEVDRMRGQRECLQALLPLDRFDALVLQIAGKVSLAASTKVLHQRLRRHRVGDAEREFLVSTMQAIGLALGWQGCEEVSHVMPKVKRVARALAIGIKCVASAAVS
jgi:AcrR family transcriptional regulator